MIEKFIVMGEPNSKHQTGIMGGLKFQQRGANVFKYFRTTNNPHGRSNIRD